MLADARRDVKHLICSREYRSIGDQKERARDLVQHSTTTQRNIAQVVGVNEKSLSRWIKHNDFQSPVGRPGYLHPDDESALVKEVLRRHAEQQSMTASDICNFVSSFTLFQEGVQVPAQVIEADRWEATTRGNLRDWFERIEAEINPKS